MRLAVIDIGSNSVLMSIIEYSNLKKTAREIHSEMRITRLARNLVTNKKLDYESKKKTLKAISDFMSIALKFKTDIIKAVATSAIREALDGEEFIRDISKTHGFTTEIISGGREAKLTCLAVKHEFPGLESFLLLDIGGGSTEIVEYSKNQIVQSFSLEIGTVRDTEHFFRNDPPTPEEIESAEVSVKNRLHTHKFSYKELVGVGGTATTLYCVKHAIDPYDARLVHGNVLFLKDITELRELFMRTTIAEKQLLPGLDPGRADIIPMGALIMEIFMKFCNCKKIIISDRGVRWGLFYETIENMN